jgi:16S rRNA processing protein RimM
VTRFITAIVGQPFGVEGFIRINSLSGETTHLRGLYRVVLRDKNGEKNYEIEAFKQNGQQLLVRFKGLDTPEAVKKLAGAEILVPRDEAAPLKDGEFYIEDLKGLNLISHDSGAPLGTITDLIEGGGGFLVEARLNSGEVKLIPFRNEFFGKIAPEMGTAELLCAWILE